MTTYTHNSPELNLELQEVYRRLRSLEQVPTVPIGAMHLWILQNDIEDQKVPDKYLLCDGTEYSKQQYPDLFSVLENYGGTASSSDGFIVPNLFIQFSPSNDRRFYIVRALP